MHPPSMSPGLTRATIRRSAKSTLRKLACCALLAIPASESFAAVAANPTLAVNITVNIDSTVRIEWTNGTNVDSARVWALPNVDLNQVIASGGNIADAAIPATPIAAGLHVTNRSQVPVDLAIGVSAQFGWTHALVANHGPNDIYTIRASTAGGTPAVSTVNAAGTLVLANGFGIELPASIASTVALTGAELVKDANLPVDLEIFIPTNVLTNSATMTVTITGSAD